ncbi:MAG TPA: FMN-binding protein [Gemmatimonadales bacterium]
MLNAIAVALDSSVAEPVTGIAGADSAPVKVTASKTVQVDTNRHSPVGTPRANGKPVPAAAPTAAPVQAIDSTTMSAAVVAAATAPVVTPDTSGSASTRQSTDSTAAAEKPRGQFKDGLYTGWGTSRHGDIEASVEIKNGHITAASITQCLTRYSCSWISDLPPEVLARQSAAVDYVSGATQSSSAFANAISEALAKAK